MIEKTLVLIKPDGVKRSLIGRIVQRFEDTGLKIIAMKMVQADEELAKNHYFLDEEWAKGMHQRTKEKYEKEGKKMPFKDHMEHGRTIQSWNIKFLTEGPVIALVLEGPHAIELVRKIIGPTEPRSAPPGTVRGDFASIESYAYTDVKSRVLRNLVHASDSVKSADREIALWFPGEKMQNYKTANEHISP